MRRRLPIASVSWVLSRGLSGAGDAIAGSPPQLAAKGRGLPRGGLFYRGAAYCGMPA
jgi:hypothetical protein